MQQFDTTRLATLLCYVRLALVLLTGILLLYSITSGNQVGWYGMGAELKPGVMAARGFGYLLYVVAIGLAFTVVELRWIRQGKNYKFLIGLLVLDVLILLGRGTLPLLALAVLVLVVLPGTRKHFQNGKTTTD